MDHSSALRHDRLDYLNAHGPLPALATLALVIAVTVTRWSVRRKTRKALAKLGEAHLNDIGLTREEAWREAALPFWKD